MPEMLFASLVFSLALFRGRRIYVDYISGFPCPLALVGLSSVEQEIRGEKESKVRVFISQTSSLQAASSSVHPLKVSALHRAASSIGPLLLNFSKHAPTSFTLEGLRIVTVLLLLAFSCCASPLQPAHTFLNSPFIKCAELF